MQSSLQRKAMPKKPLHLHDSDDNMTDDEEFGGGHAFNHGWNSSDDEPGELLMPLRYPSGEGPLRMPRRYPMAQKQTTVPPSQIPFFMIGMLFIGVAAMYTSGESVNNVAHQVELLQEERAHLDAKIREAELDLNAVQRDLIRLDDLLHHHHEGDNTNSNEEIPDGVASFRANHEMQNLQDRLKEKVALAESLKNKVQAESIQKVKQKYGEGVHRVQMELFFPGETEGPTVFTVEMAPLNVMPHAIHTFLDMVNEGLIDGCSFILNAMHVIKAAPLPYDGRPAKIKAKEFSDAGLSSVAFREYSDEYPHSKYTMGFAADGSPSFYINTEDNTDIHAGDPCFAKVVGGFDTVLRLENSPTRNGIWYAKRIGIKSARILGKEEAPLSPNKPGALRNSGQQA